MKPFNQDFKKELVNAKNLFIVVEGKNDKKALQELGFEHIFVIHQSGKSIYERIEQIESLAGNKKICILTDFDKKGKKLYLLLKSELSKRRVRLNNTLRGILLKSGVSHIEGLSSYIKNKEKNDEKNRGYRQNFFNQRKSKRFSEPQKSLYP